MNYQFGWYLFLKPLTFFSVLFFCALTLAGITASSTYVLMLGIIFPVAVSMKLHLLSLNNRVMLRETASECLVYLPGIPVQETQYAIRNVAFETTQALRNFYQRALIYKALLHILIICILCIDIKNAEAGGLWVPAAAITACVLLNGLRSTLTALYRVLRLRFEVQTQDTVWHEAFFNTKPGLSVLFSLK